MNSHNKTKSTFQKRINNLQNKLSILTRAVIKRKTFASNADAFIRKLLQEGRTTKEELSQFFKSNKKHN